MFEAYTKLLTYILEIFYVYGDISHVASAFNSVRKIMYQFNDSYLWQIKNSGKGDYTLALVLRLSENKKIVINGCSLQQTFLLLTH